MAYANLVISEKKDDYESAVKEWESACPMPNTKTLEEKVRTKLEKYFTRKKKLNQNQKISFTQIHMDMVRESVDFDDIFQYQPGTRSKCHQETSSMYGMNRYDTVWTSRTYNS